MVDVRARPEEPRRDGLRTGVVDMNTDAVMDVTRELQSSRQSEAVANPGGAMKAQQPEVFS